MGKHVWRSIIVISGLILAVSSEAKAQIGSIGISSPMRNQSIIQQSTYNAVVDFYFSIWNPGDIIIVTLYKNNSGSYSGPRFLDHLLSYT